MATPGQLLPEVFRRRKAAAFALCLYYAAQALQMFQKKQLIGQLNGTYWINRTEIAARTVFSDAYEEPEAVGWFLAHMQEYGIYLELANDRQNEAIRPIIEELYPKFKKDLRKIYAD